MIHIIVSFPERGFLAGEKKLFLWETAKYSTQYTICNPSYVTLHDAQSTMYMYSDGTHQNVFIHVKYGPIFNISITIL